MFGGGIFRYYMLLSMYSDTIHYMVHIYGTYYRLYSIYIYCMLCIYYILFIIEYIFLHHTLHTICYVKIKV